MSKKSIYLFVLLSFVQVLPFYAQSKKDSIVIVLNQVDVSISKPMYLSSKSQTTTLDRVDINQMPVVGLDNLLKSVSGFDIRNRSVGGTQADISIRGGSFDQVLVLLNGVNITDPQTGHYNLDIPVELSDVKRVELLQGSAARIYGPNAFSGVVNIVTGNPESKLSAALTTGSYNSSGQSLSAAFDVSNMKNYITFTHKSSTGYIPNTDYDIYNAFAQSLLQTSNAGKFNLQLAYQQKGYGANSFYSFSYPNQFDYTKTLFGALNWDYSLANVSFNTQVYDRMHYDRFELFRDSIKNKPSWYTTHNYHLTNVSGFKTIITAKLFDQINLASGLDIRNEHIYSNALGHLMSQSVTNIFDKSHDFTKSDNRLLTGLYVDLSRKTDVFDISLGGSGTYTQKYGALWSGGYELNYRLSPSVVIFTTGNSAMRLPTFTDLYLQNSIQKADENLKPEQSTTFEGGAKYHSGGWALNASAFYRIGRDIIDWVKLTGSTVWQSKNLADINTLGVDASAEYRFTTGVFKKVGLSYSYLNSDKQAVDFDSKYALDYLKNKLVLTVDHKVYSNLWADWQVSYNDRAGNYSDFATGKLMDYQPYFMADMKLMWKVKQVEVSGGINNLFNVRYADYGGLEQPGINFNAGIKVSL